MSRTRRGRMSKRTLEQWLSEYSVSHQNLVNKKNPLALCSNHFC